MTLQDRQTFLQLFYSGCLTITASKGKDYNPDDIPFLDLLETAVDKGDTIPGVLWVLYRKHVTAIKKHFLLHAPAESEPILNRLQDAANYMALLAFYETHKRQLHDDWRAYWRVRGCDFELANVPGTTGLTTSHELTCQRCATLVWLEREEFAIGSPTT